MQTHTVTGGGGIRLHVDETGNPAGRSILFLHGFSHCRLAWTKQLTSDLMQEFRLVTLDLRGHGLSEKPRGAYGDSHLWADGLQAVITTLRLEQPVLVGWSYGGVIICDDLRDYGQDRIGRINLVGAVTKLGSNDALAPMGVEVLAPAQGLFSNDVEESIPALQAFVRLYLATETVHHLLEMFDHISSPGKIVGNVLTMAFRRTLLRTHQTKGRRDLPQPLGQNIACPLPQPLVALAPLLTFDKDVPEFHDRQIRDVGTCQ